MISDRDIFFDQLLMFLKLPNIGAVFNIDYL